MFVIKLKTLLLYAAVLIISLIVGVVSFYCLKGQTPHIVESFKENESVELPIIMYHGLTENPSKVNTYVIPVSDFESDLKYLKENGYTAVFMQQVIDYVEGDGELPEKPVVLTFDDGFENNYEYGLPLFEKYDMRGVVSIVGKYTEDYSKISDENPEYAYLNFETISKMVDSGRFEMANHSYNMHSLPKDKGNADNRKGAAQTAGESDEVYREKLTTDTEKNQKLLTDNCGITPNVYTYPYGELTKTSEAILRDLGFKATLSCMENMNYVTKGSSESLFCLCRYLRDNKRSVQQILN